MKRLNEIIKCNYDIPIRGIQTDSRKVQKGDLFIAVKGFHVDHHQFIDEAIQNGAVAVIGCLDLKIDVIYIQVENVNDILNEVLSNYYDHVEEQFRFIGITGTDGKTTSATIVSKILDCAYIGTNGVSYQEYYFSCSNTTPEICELYECLDRLYNLGCKLIVMEVSSEALLHGRVDHLKFDLVSFTNITEDHLNIHQSMKNYIDAKKKLFSLVKKNGFSILNIDDYHYFNVKDCCKSDVYTYGKDSQADFQICKIDCQENSTNFDLQFLDSSYSIYSKLIGEYNVYNLALAFAICSLIGTDIPIIVRKIKEIDHIIGRGEKLEFGQNYTIILDYAHTYNGIYHIISNLKKFRYKKITVVTGAAGGREKEKRAKIGKMLLENVDHVIFTMDDPRYESVNSIIDDLLSDTNLINYERVIDRSKAIIKAFNDAKEGELVLILGKGRDDYMAIEDEKINYCDYDVICEYFKDSFA